MPLQIIQQEPEQLASEFVSSKKLNDVYFSVMLELACITSLSKIYREMHGFPQRCSIFEPEISPYWVRWDFGMSLTRLLAKHCRTYNLNPAQSHLWPLIDKHYQDVYKEQYEFAREVRVKPDDFEALCDALIHDNTILIGEYTLLPGEVEEATGHYGEEVFWRIWRLNKGESTVTEYHTDCYSLAKEIYYRFTGTSVDEASRGEVSKKLELYCRSVFEV